ncbi:uncharacterized protein RCO7_15079 [Rhynchosporium graminicola]|uniref:Uncharacterized protein n=1 Tax=Rhynchosporium graminicola TaxID=2792576 RepID=A0A1E1LJ81_9HELO|nr:uncharacterized protein RCO7_15079 [Rhynchosporium commune]
MTLFQPPRSRILFVDSSKTDGDHAANKGHGQDCLFRVSNMMADVISIGSSYLEGGNEMSKGGDVMQEIDELLRGRTLHLETGAFSEAQT